MGIVRFALRLPHTFYVFAVLVLFLGATAVLSMPTDIFPEINIPVVTIIWQYTGLSTPEMEQRVTTYGQYALAPGRFFGAICVPIVLSPPRFLTYRILRTV
jgi:multidrug efflux pump subunit AcrB